MRALRAEPNESAGPSNAAALPRGYKRTEIGVIPDAWDTPTISEVSRDILDYRGRTPRKLGMDWGGGDIPALSARNVKMGYVDLEEDCHFGSEALYKRWMTNGDVAKDDIVITTEAPLGNIALIPDTRKYILSQRTVLLRLNPDQLVSRFLFQVLLSQRFQRLLSEKATGSTAKGIQRKQLEKLKVIRPPLPEQSAIATALSDADRLIEALNELIAKKRSIKKATMQRLLSGEHRLPGFRGDWSTLNISERSSLKARIGWQGLTTAEYLKGGPCYLVTGTDFVDGRIKWDGCWFVDESRYFQDRNIQLRKDDILLTKDGTIGKVGFVDRLPGPATLNSGVFVIRPKSAAYDPRFFYYVLSSRIFNDFLARLQAGSTIVHLYQKDFVSFSFLAPPLQEQVAIAAVLSDMDGEITALERRLEKTMAVKRGMMQELLTGRVRLVQSSVGRAANP